MIRRLSLPLLLLLFIAIPILAGWMTAGHAVPGAPAEHALAPTDLHGGHEAHAETTTSNPHDTDCARQMSSLCLQLCSLSIMPYAASMPSLSAARPHPGRTIRTLNAPYLAPPFQPPKA